MTVMRGPGTMEIAVQPQRDIATYEAITYESVTLVQDWLLSFDRDNTRQAYRRDLEQFCTWLAGRDPTEPVDLFAVERRTVDRYARHLGETRKLKPATVARKLAQLSSLYDYAVSEQRLAHSPLSHVRRPKVSDEGVARALTVLELAELLDAAKAGGHRDFSLVSTLAVTAMRISEAVSMRIEAVRPEGRHWVVPVIRKGGEVELVPLPDETCLALDKLTEGRSDGSVFLDADAAPLDRHDAARIIHRLARAASIRDPKSVTPHSLRASYATALLQSGVPSHRVKEAMGHMNLKTTERYLRSADKLNGHANYAMADLLAEARRGGGPR